MFSSIGHSVPERGLRYIGCVPGNHAFQVVFNGSFKLSRKSRTSRKPPGQSSKDKAGKSNQSRKGAIDDDELPFFMIEGQGVFVNISGCRHHPRGVDRTRHGRALWPWLRKGYWRRCGTSETVGKGKFL